MHISDPASLGGSFRLQMAETNLEEEIMPTTVKNGKNATPTALVSALPIHHTNKEVGLRIAERRAQLGYSQREIAFPRCSYAYLSRIEAGSRRPSISVLYKLALVLDINPVYLAQGKGPKEIGAQMFKHILLALGVKPGQVQKEYEKFIVLRKARRR